MKKLSRKERKKQNKLKNKIKHKCKTQCRECNFEQFTTTILFFRSSAPKCMRCGGLLDRVYYIKINHKASLSRQDTSDYRIRDVILSELGFKSYRYYLRSSLWKGIRERVFARNNRCEVCGVNANRVHHKEYTEAVLSGDNIDSLVSLCNGCHKRIEFTNNGIKRSLSKANELLNSLMGVIP